jgi:UPF0745 protein asuc_1390
MLCAIYKSPKEAGMYLYIEKRDQFDALPEALLTVFGKPVFVMLFNLAGTKPLVNADKTEVLQQIKEKGFYLQTSKKDDWLFSL